MDNGSPPQFAEDGSEILGLPFWTTIRRETGLVEHVCEHGVGHPNEGSIRWMQEATGQGGWGVHGCDGCCTRADWPGTIDHALAYCHKLIGERNRKIQRLTRELHDLGRRLLDVSMDLHEARRPWWRKVWRRTRTTSAT